MESKKLLKVYVVCLNLTVLLLIYLENTCYPGQIELIGEGEIEVLCMERIGRASDSFV